MTHLDLNSTIGDWISERPRAVHLFASLRLDFEGGRGKPLQLACWERQVAPLDVLAQLQGRVQHDQQNNSAKDSNGSMEIVSGR